MSPERAEKRDRRAPQGAQRSTISATTASSARADSPMNAVCDRTAAGGALRHLGAADGRVRHRQGAGGARAALQLACAGTSRSWWRTARRCPTNCSRASCSATSAAPSPARSRIMSACSSAPMAAPCSSTRSARSRPAFQVKLLRVLQEGEIRPVGSAPDAQGRCARDRGDQSRSGGRGARGPLPRGSLLSPVSRDRSHMPPLRDRRDRHSGAGQDAAATRRSAARQTRAGAIAGGDCLPQAYHWPGNVRELQNEIQHMLVMGPDGRRDRRRALVAAHLAGALPARGGRATST